MLREHDYVGKVIEAFESLSIRKILKPGQEAKIFVYVHSGAQISVEDFAGSGAEIINIRKIPDDDFPIELKTTDGNCEYKITQRSGGGMELYAICIRKKKLDRIAAL